MWSRSRFRMRALLVYATAPRKAAIPNFSTAEMVFDRAGLLCPPGTCSNREKLPLPKENAQQERLDVETALCLLQEKQRHKESTKSSSAVSVL